MVDSWAWEIDGVRTELDDDPYRVIDYDGMGMPSPAIRRTALPLGGSRIVNVRFDGRACSLLLRIRGSSAEDAHSAAEALMSKMFPRSSNLTALTGELIRVRFDGTERRLRCVLASGLMLERDTWRTPLRRLVRLVFEADHPWWYSPSKTTLMGSQSANKGYPEFPLEFTGSSAGFSWGEISGGNEILINRVDNAAVPTTSTIIEMSGSLTNPFVKHLESGRQITVTATIPDGQMIRLNMGGDPKMEDDRMTVTIEPSGDDRFGNIEDAFGKITLWPGRNTIQFGHEGTETGNEVSVIWRDEFASA